MTELADCTHVNLQASLLVTVHALLPSCPCVYTEGIEVRTHCTQILRHAFFFYFCLMQPDTDMLKVTCHSTFLPHQSQHAIST